MSLDPSERVGLLEMLIFKNLFWGVFTLPNKKTADYGLGNSQ